MKRMDDMDYNRDSNQDQKQEQRPAKARNRLVRILRLNARRHARRRKFNAVDRQGAAFLLTLAVGIVGVTAAWGTGQFRRASDEAAQSAPTPSVSQTQALATFDEEAYAPDQSEPDATQSEEQTAPTQEAVAAANTLEQTLAGLRAPVKDAKVVCDFSIDELQYNETLGEWRTHNGVDYAAEEGTGVTAALDGVVSEVKKDALLGNVVVLTHENDVKSVYAGLAETAEGVKEGEKLSCGDPIGTVGATAVCEAHLGAHLHFELIGPNGYLDPEM